MKPTLQEKKINKENNSALRKANTEIKDMMKLSKRIDKAFSLDVLKAFAGTVKLDPDKKPINV